MNLGLSLLSSFLSRMNLQMARTRHSSCTARIDARSRAGPCYIPLSRRDADALPISQHRYQ